MSKVSQHPISYVFIVFTDENGSEFIRRYVAPHDGARQAADEAMRAMFGVDREHLLPTYRVREIQVFTNVEPRRLEYERVTRPDFILRERP